MKEIILNKQGLTKQAQEGYSRSGDKIMLTEGHSNMPPDSQTKGPEQAGTKPASPETQATARRAALEKAINDPNTPVELKKLMEELLKENQKEKASQVNSQRENNENDGASEPMIKDRKAADLIERFKLEHGENDPAKLQQLRLDLSGRINELLREKDKIGDVDGAYASDGKPTTATATAFAEIDDKIREIAGMQSYILQASSPDRSREGELSQAEILVNRSEALIAKLLSKGLKRNDVNDLSLLNDEEKATRAELVHDIGKFIDSQYAIYTGNFPTHILLAVRSFTELREQQISAILFKSFEDRTETNDYEVGLYAASNLDILLGFLSKDDEARYRELFSLSTATRFFHTMNSTVVRGNFEHFGQAAENINYQHFENMRDIGGSGLAMRLYEQAYKDALAKDKRVMQDAIAGIHEFVETTFREINDAGLISSEYSQYRPNSKMENWEVRRALAAGRTFLNITLRAAESIATGRVPIYNEDGSIDRRRYASEPQEDMVRILNWNEWLLAKFTVGGGKEGRQGEEFLKMSTAEFQKFLRYKGAKLDINKITEVGGVDVRKMENGGQYRTSGVYSGWRLEDMAFDKVYFNYEGSRISVQSFRDQPEIKAKIKAIKDRIDAFKKANPNKDPIDQVTLKDQEEYRNALMPLVDNLSYGLSMLLKNGDFGAQDNKLGYLLRTEIWKKIARTNTPLMVDYLTDIRYEWSGLYGENGIEKKLENLKGKSNKTPDDWLEEVQLGKEKERLLKIKAKAGAEGLTEAKTLEQLRDEVGETWKDEKKWKEFRNKILINFERTIREGMGEEMPPIAKEHELSAEEKDLEKAIKAEGEKLAPHLADIVFAYTPFMNDMPFEKFRYDIVGQTFYKRRTTSDLGGYNKGQQAFNKIVDNPGGIPPKAAIEAMGEIVAGVASPEGPRVGMEANFPTLSALLDVVTTDRGKRQGMLKMLLEATRTETSIAQRWAGIKADSFTEGEAANFIDEATRTGLLNPELARYIKKNKHLTFSAILWMLFRDVFPIVLGLAAEEFVGNLKGK